MGDTAAMDTGTFQKNDLSKEELEAFQKRIEPFTSAYNLIQDEVLITDPDARVIYANPVVFNGLGVTENEILGKNLSFLLDQSVSKEFYAQMQKTIRIEKKKFESDIKKSINGKELWRRVRVYPALDQQKDILFLIIYAVNITFRKEEIAEEINKFSEIANNIDEVFFLSTTDYKILYLNPVFEKIWGITIESVMRDPHLWINSIVPEDKDNFFAIATKNVNEGKDYNVDFRIKKPNGEVRYMHAKVVLIKDNEGKVIRSAGISSDITEIKTAEAKQKELETMKNAFIRIVTHQFRTPLTSAVWNLDMLLEEDLGKTTPEQKGIIKVSRDSIDEGIKRIGDLAEAFDIEEGRVDIKQEPVELSTLLSSVIASWNKISTVREINCRFESENVQNANISGDSEKLRLIINKLLENAIWYTQPNGKVTITLTSANHLVKITIEDTGIGIPQAEQDKIFTKFYRASNASTMKPDASGLGLYIAKNLIEQHKGIIGFNSTEGQGSTFWIEFPTV